MSRLADDFHVDCIHPVQHHPSPHVFEKLNEIARNNLDILFDPEKIQKVLAHHQIIPRSDREFCDFMRILFQEFTVIEGGILEVLLAYSVLKHQKKIKGDRDDEKQESAFIPTIFEFLETFDFHNTTYKYSQDQIQIIVQQIRKIVDTTQDIYLQKAQLMNMNIDSFGMDLDYQFRYKQSVAIVLSSPSREYLGHIYVYGKGDNINAQGIRTSMLNLIVRMYDKTKGVYDIAPLLFKGIANFAILAQYRRINVVYPINSMPKKLLQLGFDGRDPLRFYIDTDALIQNLKRIEPRIVSFQPLCCIFQPGGHSIQEMIAKSEGLFRLFLELVGAMNSHKTKLVGGVKPYVLNCPFLMISPITIKFRDQWLIEFKLDFDYKPYSNYPQLAIPRIILIHVNLFKLERGVTINEEKFLIDTEASQDIADALHRIATKLSAHNLSTQDAIIQFKLSESESKCVISEWSTGALATKTPDSALEAGLSPGALTKEMTIHIMWGRVKLSSLNEFNWKLSASSNGMVTRNLGDGIVTLTGSH